MAGIGKGKLGSKGVAHHFWGTLEVRYLVLSRFLCWDPSQKFGLGARC